MESCIDHATGRAIEGPPIDESGEGEGAWTGDNGEGRERPSPV